MIRRSPGHPLKAAALVLLAFLVITNATARHRKSSNDSEPGTFDYYLLSLSWSPAFCLGEPGAAEFSGPRLMPGSDANRSTDSLRIIRHY
jgi:hypothetical protein